MRDSGHLSHTWRRLLRAEPGPHGPLFKCGPPHPRLDDLRQVAHPLWAAAASVLKSTLGITLILVLEGLNWGADVKFLGPCSAHRTRVVSVSSEEGGEGCGEGEGTAGPRRSRT